jgi:ATP-dependent helicase/nuclease subunit A
MRISMKKRPPTQLMGELFDFPIEAQPEPEQEIIPAEPAAISAKAQPPDHAERGRALDVTRSWIVEAPAGSGKTGLLIQRYLKLLALPSVEEPEQVLAITFTLKATGEIRERVLKQIERAAGPDTSNSDFDRDTRALALAVLERDRALGWNLLEHPRRLNVRTIDSVCSEIARSLPVLSGSGRLSPVEDARPLYRLAAEHSLMQLGGNDVALDRALRLILLHRDGNLAQVRDLLAEMLSLRDQWARLVPLGRMLEEAYLDQTVLPQIERALASAICTELTRLAERMPPHLLDELSSLAAGLASNEGYNDEPNPIALCSGLFRSPGTAAHELEQWQALAHLMVKPSGGWRSGFNRNHLGFQIDKQQAASLREIIDQLSRHDGLLDLIESVAALPPAKYPQEQWRVAKALFRVLYRALAELQVVFAERGECDFTEPGLIARSALTSDAASLETAVGLRLQHILIDEMQDTSTSQYELVQLLTQGWDGHSQTVFLVGDPKQSIYLFRQARVERFICTMQQQRLGDIPLGCLRLTANFRSQGDLVQSFNHDFSQLFPAEIDEDHLETAPYVAASPIRGRAADVPESIVWHAQVVSHHPDVEERRRTRRKLARREAIEVRKVIEQWRARPLPEDRREPWKIAVLVRNRPHLNEIVTALKREPAVPFRAVNIESLDERPEVLDLFALTRALLHPADRTAWLAILRAPWCGLELSELHLIAGSDDPLLFDRTIEELLLARGQELSEQTCQRLARIWPILRSAIAQHSRLPLAQWIERTWRSLGGDVALTAEQQTNTRRYFELLDEIERLGAVDLSQIRQRLRSLYAESAAIPGAVELITIHGAKGLEWDVVLVPGLEKRSRAGRSRLLTWNEIPASDENSAQILLAPIAGKGRDSTALNDWLNRIQRSREEAEYRRLFYVACTRAREELHLFATPNQRQNGELRHNYGSLLQCSWPVAEPHFVDVQSEARPLIAPVIALPTPNETLILPSLAAGAEEPGSTAGLIAGIEEPKPAILYRLSLTFEQPRRQQLPTALDPSRTTKSFERPEGTFEARAFGNTVHTLLEHVATLLAAGSTPEALECEVEVWSPRIAAILRATGLPPRAVERLVPQVQTALTNTLRDPQGRWILQNHPLASNEASLVSWSDTLTNVRLDRTFHAGSEPLLQGQDYLWIIDYKTSQHTPSDHAEFFAREREKYAPQLETYTRTLNPDMPPDRIRLGLYYPMLASLIWWTPYQ